MVCNIKKNPSIRLNKFFPTFRQNALLFYCIFNIKHIIGCSFFPRGPSALKKGREQPTIILFYFYYLNLEFFLFVPYVH